MFECKVTVHMPDLLLATDKLAALLRGTAPAAPAPTPVSHTPAAPQQPAIPQTTQAPAPQPTPVNPTQAAPVHTSPTPDAAAPIATTFNAPTAIPVNPAPVASPPTPPVAQAPQYTIEAISRAGAALVQAGKMPELQTLLQQFSVQALTQLQPEQYGPFATALRGLGAQI